MTQNTPTRRPKKGSIQAPRIPPNSSRPRAMPKPNKVHDCQTTRYFRALEVKLGKVTIYQLTKIEGHILVGLFSVKLADKLIEEGLDIEDATLRAFPLRKRAERIVIGNVFFFVEDADLVAALRPFGQPAEDGGHANFCRNWADCPEQEDKLIERQDVIFTKVGGSKKRPHDPDRAKSGAKKGCVPAPGMPLNSSRPRATPRPSKVHECQTTRQKQATFRARSAVGQADKCVYLEFCPDFTQEEYFRALETKLGKGNIYQLTKMEGHILVGLYSVQLAGKLIEEGLNIEDATLRAFPLRKRGRENCPRQRALLRRGL
ncbi:hypothetical protein LAZ67_5002190 [Cordylochernes scorpioides]|uniref:Uncharacterized protein n=1 Tax=Cordylochernes scorpioides TaxID=51811 RepID=A0ABY6KHB6_9ARAC|nr:hypothetical protein LAZ67_5002190 [Cordylochernes scorpioides]